MFAAIPRCLACDSDDKLLPVLDLGTQPLANGFHLADEVVPAFPLALNHCPRCYHCQLSVSVSPTLLFAYYLYVSGTTRTSLDYFASFAQRVTSHRQDAKLPCKTVLDIACNDGSQLDAFKQMGWKTYGVDPAANIVPVAQGKGHRVLQAFWTPEVAGSMVIEEGELDVIVAQNVLAHTPDPLSFLQGIRSLCTGSTDVYIQTSQMQMFAQGEFDTMYHEHVSFFSVRSMSQLADRAGLCLVDVNMVPMHGGSAVFRLKVNSRASPSVQQHMQLEAKTFGSPTAIEQFTSSAKSSMSLLRRVVEEARAEGHGVVGFGAAAKAMTVLCAAQVRLDYIVDDNPLKQGLLSPGMNCPVVSSQQLAHDERSLLILVLAWNFAEEITAKAQSLRSPSRGDMLICKYIFASTSSPPVGVSVDWQHSWLWPVGQE